MQKELRPFPVPSSNFILAQYLDGWNAGTGELRILLVHLILLHDFQSRISRKTRIFYFWDDHRESCNPSNYFKVTARSWRTPNLVLLGWSTFI